MGLSPVDWANGTPFDVAITDAPFCIRKRVCRVICPTLTWTWVYCALLQFEAIRKYVEGGGSVLILSGEGGEARSGTNINYLLEEYVIHLCLPIDETTCLKLL